MIKDMDSMLEGTNKKEGHFFFFSTSSCCHLNRTAFSLHSLAALQQHSPIFRETPWEQSILQLGGTGLVQYLAFGWRAVCALVCVDAGRGHGSTKVPLGNARNLASWRHLHRSKLGSIQLLEKQKTKQKKKIGVGGETGEESSISKSSFPNFFYSTWYIFLPTGIFCFTRVCFKTWIVILTLVTHSSRDERETSPQEESQLPCVSRDSKQGTEANPHGLPALLDNPSFPETTQA